MPLLSSKKILLFDLPTFPKGTIALSLYAVAGALGNQYVTQVIDLNLLTWEEAKTEMGAGSPLFLGLKVSAQNAHLAIEYTQVLKNLFPDTPVIWGGEYPTLLPKESLQHCHAIVTQGFEKIASQLLQDLENETLQEIYAGNTQGNWETTSSPRLDLVPHFEKAHQFMGLPLETSRGCTFKCTFCLVHQMQPGYELKPAEKIAAELKAYQGQFINLIDYNYGVYPDHVIQTAALIKDSGAVGWMAEMCLESLDNDDMLAALAESRCRMIYCGIESIDEMALRSVNKAKTNQIIHYERIIRKVQSYGIQIGAGVILGLPGTQPETFERTLEFFSRMGIYYAKLTFLTYNPGTKVKRSMLRKGSYLSEDPAYFDGNHLSFLAEGLEPEVIFQGASRFIESFYSLKGILARADKIALSPLEKREFILFNLCYRSPYLQWLEKGVFADSQAFDQLLRAPLEKSPLHAHAERMLLALRKERFQQDHPSSQFAETISP